MAAIAAEGGRVQEAREDRDKFLMSDNNALVKQVQATHVPDGREFDVKPLIHVIEDIMHRSTPPIPGLDLPPVSAQLDALTDRTLQNGISDIIELLAYHINSISCEVSCKCSKGSDTHTTTLALLNQLSSYSWEAKVVIVLAAFAVNYGEFWLVAQFVPSNPLAKSLAFLKKLPDILEPADSLKPKFEPMTNLIKAILNVTKCIVEMKELPSQYITPDMLVTVTATTYWTIRSIVACASQIKNLIGMGNEYMELSSMGNELQKQLALCNEYTYKGYLDPYHMLARLFETAHMDSMKIFKALIYFKEDQLPLIDGYTKRRVSLDVLRGKKVLLLISDLELSHEEHLFLYQMYVEAQQNPESQYEIVWIPVTKETVPWEEVHQKKFKGIQASMPWFSVHHPSLLDPGAIKYINQVWHFNNKPMLVAIDPWGKVVNHNAIHMMWIWGNYSFPFSSMREEALWKEMTWTIELLAGSIDQSIVDSIAAKRYICLYGGEDLDWIRRFTNTARAVAQAAQIPLDMVYVGKSNPRTKVVKIKNIIMKEKLSHTLPDVTLIWFFWARLESMSHSKKRQYNKSVGLDSIVQHYEFLDFDFIMQNYKKFAGFDSITEGISTILNFDRTDQEWAVISQGGTTKMAKAKGDIILKSLTLFDEWKDHVGDREGKSDFVTALVNNLHELHNPFDRKSLISPSTTKSIPDTCVCAKCGNLRVKMFMFQGWSTNAVVSRPQI